MKLTYRQKTIILNFIRNEREKYKTHELKMDSEYKQELDKLEEKMSEPKQNFDKVMLESMKEHSSREDW